MLEEFQEVVAQLSAEGRKTDQLTQESGFLAGGIVSMCVGEGWAVLP